MIAEIIKDLQMSADFESEWFPLVLDYYGSSAAKDTAVSMQIEWKDVSGTPDGCVYIYVSNYQNSHAEAMTVNINKVSNSDDSLIIILNPVYKFLKFKYEKNSITGGTLNVVMAFEKM